MKITACLMFSVAINLSAADTYSQNTRVSLNVKNSTIEKVLDEIEQKSEYYFLYNRKLVDVLRKVDVVSNNRPIKDVLKHIFDHNDVRYFVYDRQIILTNASAGDWITGPLQQGIRGRVTDESGAPIPGVNILVVGTTIGTVSDADGQYALEGVRPEHVISFSFIGYVAEKVVVGDQSVVNISLKPEIRTLDEVVVVGYGVQKKVNLTGAVSSVGPKELSSKIAHNAVSNLAGELPGVFITEGTGQPGRTGLNVLIRGLGTMNNAAPMIMVDGEEAVLTDVNPNDIENISVLKDAASASIYGTRAANGVILVTTKRGKAGPAQFNFKSSVGWQKPVRLFEKASAAEVAEMINESRANNGLPPTYTDQQIELYRSGTDPINYPNTDWVDLILQGSGFAQNHDLSVSGGTDAARYRVSLGYFDQKGLMKYTGFQRYNSRINLDTKINKWLNMGLNLGMSRSESIAPTAIWNNVGIEQFFRQAIRIPATAINKAPDGLYVPWSDGNPIAWLESGSSILRKNSHFLGSLFGEITLMEGLTLKGQMGTDFTLDDDKNHMKTITYSGGVTEGPNKLRNEVTRDLGLSLQSWLTYEKTFGVHALKLLLGTWKESTSNNYLMGFRQNFPSNDISELTAGSTDGQTNNGRASETRLGSYFGRVNYVYKSKYLLEANVRRDGSSKFGRDYRWGTFPSFSAGWRLSQEEFMKNVTWLDDLKVRGSWGKLGNHNISNYLYIARISLGSNYPFPSSMEQGAATTAAAVPDITWETTTEWNLGIDASLFNNGELSFSVDYYDKYTDDILTSVPVSVVFGLPAPTINAGAMRNKGIEFQLSHRKNIGQINYSLTTNFALNENLVEKYPNPSKGSTIRAEGVAWDSHYGYEVESIASTDNEALTKPHVAGALVKAGDFIYVDQNNDNIINADDRIVLGNSIPKITYAFTLNLGYKGFDLTAFFQGAGKVSNTLGGQITFPLNDGQAVLKEHLDRTIIADGEVVKLGNYPRLGGPNGATSSFTVFQSDYLRMKNLSFGYTLPSTIASKMQLNRLRVYFSGQNLLTFTEFPKSFDPEVAGYSGRANGMYPQVAFYMFGLDLNF
ncbi:MAG: TonB-dependent receptor [Cyclobacteriaceae bacterium]